MAIKHSTVVTVPDDGTSPVGTDEWNDNHTIENNTITDTMISAHTTTKITVPVAKVTGLATSATTDTTNATNITTGTLPLSRLSGITNTELAISAKIESIIVAASDETTALTVGTGKITFRMPYAFTLTDVRASLTTAGGTSGTTTIDINEGGVSILSTLLTIDNTEKTSTTAVTPAVISDTALADDSEITVDVDAITGGATEAGLKITLIGYQT